MYKNIIINKEFDSLNNEIIETVPILYRGFIAYKIDLLKITIMDQDTIVNTLRINDQKSENLFLDNFQYKMLHASEIVLAPKVCYTISNGDNNSVILNKNINFNMICLGFFNGIDCNMDSDWIKGVDKFYFAFFNEDFLKLPIKNIFINIKLRYETDTI